MEARRTSRILLLDPQCRVLLIKIIDPRLPAGQPARDRGLWITPGGGVREDEDNQQAAERELLEETGLRVSVSPPRWYGEQVLTVNGAPRLLKETFFTARATSNQVTDVGLEPDEASVIREYRWWSADELASTADAFAPPVLPVLLKEAAQEPDPAPMAPKRIELA